MNWSLFAVIYIIAGTVTTGMVIIGTLIMGFDEIAHMQVAVAVGALASIPITIYFAKKVGSITGNEEGYEAYFKIKFMICDQVTVGLQGEKRLDIKKTSILRSFLINNDKPLIMTKTI